MADDVEDKKLAASLVPTTTTTRPKVEIANQDKCVRLPGQFVRH